jgi:hypothetical protein
MRICIHVQLYNLTFISLSWLPYHRDPQIPHHLWHGHFFVQDGENSTYPSVIIRPWRKPIGDLGILYGNVLRECKWGYTGPLIREQNLGWLEGKSIRLKKPWVFPRGCLQIFPSVLKQSWPKLQVVAMIPPGTPNRDPNYRRPAGLPS